MLFKIKELYWYLLPSSSSLEPKAPIYGELGLIAEFDNVVAALKDEWYLAEFMWVEREEEHDVRSLSYAFTHCFLRVVAKLLEQSLSELI